MSFRVLATGLNSLIVDQGRPGSRSTGVPLGGAADRAALALGNALVGNPPEAAALEMTLIGPTLEVLAARTAVVFGAGFESSLDGRPLPPGKTFAVPPGSVVQVGPAATAVRGYLCVPGGFTAPTLLGSRSAFSPITPGDLLQCPPVVLPPIALPFAEVAGDPELVPPPRCLRVLDGPQADWFDRDSFRAATFHVQAASDRMGVRLSGPSLSRPARELVSEPVSVGAVQVTNDGQCIILGVDGQTIGGYPKIAQVIRADLDAIGQLRPGAIVRFIPVALADAEAIYRRRVRALRGWTTRLRLTRSGPD